jgi:drug/metabolite transporter (DMT)-like permease
VSARKYFVLAAIVVFGACGDVALSRGMKDVGNLSVSDPLQVLYALANPWVVGGILLLIGFMSCYLTALSFADLTYVLPATAVGYILMAILAKAFLHETVNPKRWAGILLISAGVGFVAGGPSLTEPESAPCEDVATGNEQ